MDEITWSLQEIKAKDLKPYTHNPKKRDPAGFSRLQKSLAKFGRVFDGIANQDLSLIDGHSRLELSDPEETLKIFIPSRPLSEGDYKEMNAIFDMAKAGETDTQILEEQFTDEFFSEWEIARASQPEVVEDDYEIPDEIETDIQLGDLFEIGAHRLLCGDSRDQDALKQLFGNQMADLVVTDPPYNVDYTGKTKDSLKIDNDKKKNQDFYQFLFDFYNAFGLFTKAGGAWYVWHAPSEVVNFGKAFIDAGFLLKQQLIWVKNTMVMGRQDYQWKHESCLYGWKAGAAHGWYSDRKQTTLLEFDRPQRSKEHPTMKPVALMGYLINNSSKAGDLIGDGFLGSGTTMVACEQLNRRCFGMEIDPKYCQVIVDRMKALNSGLKIKKNGILIE